MLARAPGLGLCIDTGHTIVGGGDPLALARRHVDTDPPPASEGRRRRRARAAASAGEVDMDEAWPLGIFCEFGAGVVPAGRVPRAARGAGARRAGRVIEQDRVAVTVDDMPVVRAADERNRARVEEWLA